MDISKSMNTDDVNDIQTGTSTSVAPGLIATAPASADIESPAEKIAGLNSRLKQSMSVIKALKASESTLKITVQELQQTLQLHTIEQQKWAEKDLLITHLQVTCDGLKEEIRKTDAEHDKDSSLLSELVHKLTETQQQCNKLSLAREEQALAIISYKDLVEKSSQRVQEVEQELQNNQQQQQQLSIGQSSVIKQKVELELLLTNLRNDLTASLDRNAALEEELKEQRLLRDRMQLDLDRYARNSHIERDLKEELESKNIIITRLHSEAQKAEQNHAMRTAMLAGTYLSYEIAIVIRSFLHNLLLLSEPIANPFIFLNLHFFKNVDLLYSSIGATDLRIESRVDECHKYDIQHENRSSQFAKCAARQASVCSSS